MKYKPKLTKKEIIDLWVIINTYVIDLEIKTIKKFKFDKLINKLEKMKDFKAD